MTTEIGHQASGLLMELQSAALKDGVKQYTFRTRTPGPDRNGNITDMDGWRFAQYLQNPTLTVNHDHNLLVGKGHNVWIEAPTQQMYAAVSFADTELAHQWQALVDQGILRAISPQWIPIDAEIIEPIKSFPPAIHYHEQNLVDLSLVVIPADAESLRVAALHNDTIFPHQVTQPRFDALYNEIQATIAALKR